MKRATTNSTFHNHTIMTDKEKGLSCDLKILHEIERQFDYAEQTKSKTFFMRLDSRLPIGYLHSDNSLFRSFYCIGRGLLKENQLVCSIIVNRA